MRSGDTRAHRWSAPQHITNKTWVASPPHPEAPLEWLRRPYTRTIAKNLRTVDQLRRSFEDACSQWRTVCTTAAQASQTHSLTVASSSNGAASNPFALPRDTRGVVDRVVSQVKSVKQELLAHLTRMLETLSARQGSNSCTQASTAGATGLSEEERWLRDLRSAAGTHADAAVAACAGASPASPSADMAAYLCALWLSRRVWVWSVGLACATMDLELLSGSVSVATQLFFGCPFAPAGALVASEDCDGDLRALDSCYSIAGAITEKSLYSAARQNDAADDTQNGTRAALREEREFAAFLGVGLDRADAPGSAAASPLEKPSTGWPRDAFWVHALALFYSVLSRDDATAARLWSLFDAAFATQSTGLAETADTSDETQRGATAQHGVWRATRFVLQMAQLLVGEDYKAAHQLLREEGYLATLSTVDSSGAAPQHTKEVRTQEEDQQEEEEEAVVSGRRHSAPLADTCPEGFVSLLLLRLLSEHVVRRRWTEQLVGNAFRPIEPTQEVNAPGKAGVHETMPHRLVSVLTVASSGPSVHTDPCVSVAGCSPSSVLKWSAAAAASLCQALQVAALRDMGGEWPLPPSLLHATFGGI